MKKIYYLLAVAATVLVSACNPLDKTYKQIGDLPTPKVPDQTITLSGGDYGLLPKGHAAKTSFYFASVDTAKTDIPVILNSKFPTYPNTTKVTVTYAGAPLSVKPVDSLISNISYTATNADYIAILGSNPKYLELTTAQAIKLLTTKYPNAVNNQMVLLNYLFYESGVVSTATNVTDTFIFMNGAWVKGYTITAAQFAYVGNTYGDFSASDAPYIVSYLNAILKADQAATLKANVGDVKYVSFKYYASSKLYQRIMVLVFDGSNWTVNTLPALPQVLSFVKTNGVWVADNTVTIKLASADYKFIAAIPGVASDAAMANLNSFGNFNIQGGATSWTDTQINNGIIALLKSKYPAAVVNQKFVVTYAAYNGSNITVTKTFVYDGTTFKLQ